MGRWRNCTSGPVPARRGRATPSAPGRYARVTNMGRTMNSIVYIVGAVVIVIAILSFLGLG
jgi:hypothetical protein